MTDARVATCGSWILAALVAALLAGPALAQEEEAEATPPPAEEPAEQPAEGDPLGTRLIDTATPFPVGARLWEILFTHRFQQTVQDGSAHDLWGLDGAADVGIGMTFGLTRRLDLGLYRSSFQEDYEVFGKLLLFEQRRRVPLSVAVRAGVNRLEREGVADPTRPFAQLLVVRRFGGGVNLLVAPSWVGETTRLSDAMNVPVGLTLPLPHGRLLELEVVPANRDLDGSITAWHVGFSHDVGRHIFEVVLGNSRATTVDQMLGSDFPPGFAEDDVRLGFNLIRLFPF
ncbi:MAG TPA: DUF5777 family beta-barrel protein [Thermoanaerobaculia bacterium]